MDRVGTVAVVGAGIVGVATALWLARDGHRVVLIDKAGPGAGASSGNAGVLASCAVVPVTEPGLWRQIPRMLLDRDAPLFLRKTYLPRLIPWLMRYMSHATDAEARRIAQALFPIVGDSLNDHQALAAGTPAERWLVPSDYVYLYKDRAAFEGDGYSWGLKRAAGFTPQEMEAVEVRAYEPLVGGAVGFAARMGGHGHITDPGAYVAALAAEAERLGARMIRAEVTEVIRDNGRVTGLRAGGESIACDAVAITAGAFSGPLCKALGLRVPLESERGYHLELWEPSAMPRAPLMVTSGAFVATPMEGRLRLAGMLEFGGLEAGPSRAPFDLLRRKLREAMPALTWARETEWMGHRPALPDSLPAIGPVPGVQGAWLGFGHHHVGLTGGPKTGRLLAQMIAGRAPNIDMAPYAPARFARA
ncbi:NAD(P)/FAD-dependent oxidoreductase [Thetidibacter halocola]|uniref:FAD-binding oxidoreductase n=1 Tax=Thetidibacter halocola TaxID=2827239 RepID=A0A8J7WIX6_9RHOB|nr:FAD-binding oxidoreductase [Thetidibacter halocola]MBS0126158.1 FAD-binding oxidoreductase [Thetidibacter halocola]